MPTKIFTTISGPCPFGYHNKIDDNLCRLCPYYYRTGTGTFFWCNHPPMVKAVRKPRRLPENKEPEAQPKRKRGRPPGKATKRPVNKTKKKNG